MKAPSEKHLEDWIFDDISRLDFFSSGNLYSTGTVYRQVKMRRGIADIVYVSDDFMTVVELKKGEIDDSALQQVLRYVGDLKDTWEEVVYTIPAKQVFPGKPTHGGLNISGILIGYSSNEHTLAAAWGADISTYKYEYDGDGDYALDWLFHSARYNQNNPLEYSEISDSMIRMARNYLKKHDLLGTE